MAYEINCGTRVDRLGDFGQIDLDDCGVLCVGVSLEQGDVRTHVLGHRFLVQGDGTGSSGTLCGGGQLESLFDLEIRQAFDFQDAAGEDVLLALEPKYVMASETLIAIITE